MIVYAFGQITNLLLIYLPIPTKQTYNSLKLETVGTNTLSKKTQKLNYTLVALISIKPEYDFENRYLNNNFSVASVTRKH
jgi:hypothetical protein